MTLMHYRILSEMFLLENSVGNITRLLGASKGWANYFQNAAGSQAFAIANWFVTGAPRKAFSRDPEGNRYDESIQEIVDDMMFFAPLREGATPIQRAIEFLSHSIELSKILARPNPNRTALDRAITKVDSELASPEVGEKLLDLSGGYSWKVLTDLEFTRIACLMSMCGIPSDETMLALFDEHGAPHAVASWNERSNTLDQISGKANSHPSSKYMPMVQALLKHLEATLEKGDDSFLGVAREFREGN